MARPSFSATPSNEPAKKKLPPLTIENARLIWRNFAGRQTEYNAAGNRNFNVVIPPEDVEPMLADGWNVKTKAPREEDGDPLNHMEVTVGYSENSRPPRVVMLAGESRVELDRDTVAMVDRAEIEKVDLIINPYHWEVNGKTGVKAYLRSIYITIVQDDLEKKYGSFPQSEAPSNNYPDDSPFD